MKREATPRKPAVSPEPVSLHDLLIRLLTEPSDQRRLQSLLQEHHYLGKIKPVGERMLYAA
ncbi:MAG: hypothetical protein IT581_01200, partial [Verrucomicrobiales bacterium]|nr:hypothetical protein [Verrucomicrobiales bacterium]